MTKRQEIVKAVANAWNAKDKGVLRKHLHEYYSFQGPMMSIVGAEENIKSVDDCPFESTFENSEMIEQGDRVVHMFDWLVSAPFQANIPVVEVTDFVEDKMSKTRFFFDTGKMPAECVEQMKRDQDATVKCC